jgi:hypothetical protein
LFWAAFIHGSLAAVQTPRLILDDSLTAFAEGVSQKLPRSKDTELFFFDLFDDFNTSYGTERFEVDYSV